MSLTTLTCIVADLIALAVLVGILHAPRHSRKDLMVTYIGVNVGTLTVTLLLLTTSVAAGSGLRLFGVLSVIHLHSTELTQHEVTHFFVALTLDLLDRIQITSIGMVTTLMGTVATTLWINDRPAFMRRNHHQVIILNYAIISETTFITHLGHTLGGQVSSVEIQHLNLIDDTTTAGVRFRVPRHIPAELETTTAFDDIAPTAQPAAEPIGAIARKVQTVQPWSGTRLNTMQVDSRPESVEAQPFTTAPATQYVIRSSNQMASSTAVTPR